MNNIESFHPILVHFPVALLTVYAILECIRFKKVREAASYFYVKAFLSIIGFLAALAAFSTGPEGLHIHSWSGYVGMTGSNGMPLVRQIVGMHSSFAFLTMVIFAVIAASYLIAWIGRQYSIHTKVWNFFAAISRCIQKPYILIVLALLGLVAVTITGALGGAIVYGPDIDPFVSGVCRLFF